MKHLSDENFKKCIDSEDELGSVIKTHIHIEELINEILTALVKRPEELKHLNLDYDSKINLLSVLGVDPSYKSCFKAIGKLRNKYAHRIDFSMTNEDMENLYNTLNSDNKEFLSDIYKSFQKGANKNINSDLIDKNFKDLSPRQRFVFLAITIRNFALHILVECRNEIV